MPWLGIGRFSAEKRLFAKAQSEKWPHFAHSNLPDRRISLAQLAFLCKWNEKRVPQGTDSTSNLTTVAESRRIDGKRVDDKLRRCG
jgi:hypothetical protein